MGNTSCGVDSCTDCKHKSDFLENVVWPPEKHAALYAPAGSPCGGPLQLATPSNVSPLDQVVFDDASRRASKPVCAREAQIVLDDAACRASTQASAGDNEFFVDDPGGPGTSIGEAQEVVKAFVQTVVRGLKLSAVSPDGEAECIVFLDRKLTTMYLQPPKNKEGNKRSIALEIISEIAVGEDVSEEAEQLDVDEKCVTMLLSDGEAIAFRFGDMEARDTFALCLSMFVDGRRAEVRRNAGRT